jgi:hypothetical protein
MSNLDLDEANPPMSVKEISEKAQEYDWNPRIAFKYWARAAETIHHEVHPFAAPLASLAKTLTTRPM